MKDAKGHGSDPRGAHASGVEQIGKPVAAQDWFNGSKVVDSAGQPLTVYHGSPDVRQVLEEGFKTPHERFSGKQGEDEGYFATSDYRVANSYADPHRAFDYQNSEPGVVPLHLSIKNPMVVDAKGAPWRGTAQYVQQAKAAGHDGLIIKNSMDYYNSEKMGGPKGQKPTTVYAWFKADQAKSATPTPLLSRTDRKPLSGKWLTGAKS